MINPISRLVLYLFLLSIVLSCSSNDESDICYQFDQRQCQTDPWHEDLALYESLSARVEAHLSRQSIDVLTISNVELTGATCLACDVCADGNQFVVKITAEDEERLQALDLLNILKVDCR